MSTAETQALDESRVRLYVESQGHGTCEPPCIKCDIRRLLDNYEQSGRLLHLTLERVAVLERERDDAPGYGSGSMLRALAGAIVEWELAESHPGCPACAAFDAARGVTRKTETPGDVLQPTCDEQAENEQPKCEVSPSVPVGRQETRTSSNRAPSHPGL